MTEAYSFEAVTSEPLSLQADEINESFIKRLLDDQEPWLQASVRQGDSLLSIYKWRNLLPKPVRREDGAVINISVSDHAGTSEERTRFEAVIHSHYGKHKRRNKSFEKEVRQNLGQARARLAGRPLGWLALARQHLL